MPKLRRNRKTDTRWSDKYYTAVKNAVFITETEPYEPTLSSFPLNEYAPEYENLYMCTQCRDCFYFRSSLEDHIARKSWILGYWCHHCFVTDCKHSSLKGVLCSTCSQLDHEKRLYLRTKGLHNNQKFGAIRIFYNQCQFFAHLKAHKVDMVNITDLMLMPLPTNIIDWNPKVDLICEALMEHTFIIKVHIMDWLKDKTIDNNWWQLAEDADNPVTVILQGYNGRFYFKPLEISIEKQISVLNSAHSTPNNDEKFSDIDIPESVESVDKGTSPSSTDTRVSISDKSTIENNCGVSKSLESEFPANKKERRGNRTVSVKSAQDSCTPKRRNVINKYKRNKVRHINTISSYTLSRTTVIATKRDIRNLSKRPLNKQLWKSLILRKNVLRIKPLSKIEADVSYKANVERYKKNLARLKQNLHRLTGNSRQKDVRFQTTKHADNNTINNQKPPDDNSKESSSEGVIGLVPVGNEKSSKMKINIGNKDLSQAGKETNRNSSKNQTEAFKSKLRPFPDRVIYQNGQKCIIKQSSGLTKNLKNTSNAVVPVKNVQGTVKSKSTNIPALISLDSTEIENITNQEKTNSFHNDVSPLTPSPSPSELSNSSSCDIQLKQTSLSAKGSQKVDVPYLNTERKNSGINVQNMNNSFEKLTFRKGEDQNLYLDVKFRGRKPIYSIVDTSAMITKCREEMLNEFFYLSFFELKKRYDHLQEIGEEISRVMNFVTDNVIKENIKAVHILQTVLKHCAEKCTEKSDDTEEKDALLHEWESEYEKTDEKPVCKACNKIKKPKYYIPGFSKPAKNDIYCSCYRHMCHKCHTYQGNSTRFVAHQTFHDKKRPYLCPDCYRKFTSYRSLEVHTWTTCFHTLKRRVLGCKICEIDGFQDMESIAEHFAIMHTHNKVVCDKCYIVLPSYSEYRKHHKDKHSDENDHQPIRLVLCKLGRCIVRCEDYMLHMEKHIVVQRLIWFKCPLCTFIHVEAKRITSHLQSKHKTRLEELRCSQTLWNNSQAKTGENLLKNSLQQNKFTNAHARSREDGTVMPKIINARTITSEVFEHGAQGTDDNIINYETPLCSKVVNVNSESSPKLSGTIPKILDVRTTIDLTSDISECDRIEATSKSIDTTTRDIINARNITSEVFERGAQETDDNIINYETPLCSKVVNVNSESSPKLSGTIPKILDVRTTIDLTSDISECDRIEATSKSIDTTTSEIVNARNITSEVFKRGAQQTDDNIINYETPLCSKVVNVNSESSPKLSGTIPKILDVRTTIDLTSDISECDNFEATSKSIDTTTNEIINARNIKSEVFERDAQGMDDNIIKEETPLCSTVVNVNSESSPKLSGTIPKILDVRTTIDLTSDISECDNFEATSRSIDTTTNEIINARNIKSEVFERDAQGMDDNIIKEETPLCSTVVNVNSESSPKLSGIIPKIVDVRTTIDLTSDISECDKFEATSRSIDTTTSEIVNARNMKSEVFERDAQGMDDNIIKEETPLCSTVVDVNSESSPKLSGIIPKIVDVRTTIDLTSDISECDKFEATSRSIDTTTSDVINARNIKSEVFERDVQGMDDNIIKEETSLCSTVVNVNSESSPKLSGIIPKILDVVDLTSDISECDKFEATSRSIDTTTSEIINAGNIKSEVFGRDAQGMDDNIIKEETPLCSTVVNVNSESLPKLSGITPKILDVVDLTSDISECDKFEATSRSIDTTTSEIINAGNIKSEVFGRDAQGIDGNIIKGESEENRAYQDQDMKIDIEHVINSTWGTKTIQQSLGLVKVEPPQQDQFLEVKNESIYDTSCEEAKIQLDGTNQAMGVSNNTQSQKQPEAITRGLISKLPPLVKIPKHVLEMSRSKIAGQINKGGGLAVFSRDQEINCYFPRRIALINSTNLNEILNFPCPSCRELINTSKSVISNHFHSKHLQDCKLSAIAVNLQRISPEFINGGYKELLDNKKRKSESTISNTKRRRRWNPKKYNNDGKNVNFSGLGLCVTQETAEDSEGNFRCKKCDQRCSNMTNLREHIACNHRIKGRNLVCLECGDNFVVVPSLQMHLKAFHGIEDPITYMAQNTSYAPDNVDDLEAEGKSIEANQCHVCMAVFEDKAAVDKHLRVHGMAFLNRKRIEAQNALKGPEKKSETEEEKCTPMRASRKELVRKDKPAETILEKITATM